MPHAYLHSPALLMTQWPVRSYDTVAALAGLAGRAGRLHLQRSVAISRRSARVSTHATAHTPATGSSTNDPESKIEQSIDSAVKPRSSFATSTKPTTLPNLDGKDSAAGVLHSQTEDAALSPGSAARNESSLHLLETMKSGSGPGEDAEKATMLRASRVPSSRFARLFQYGSTLLLLLERRIGTSSSTL